MKIAKWLSIVAALMLCATALFACKPADQTKQHTVTFYDGETVLKSVAVNDGEKVEKWEPTKEGYTFVGWYATPSLRLPFRFEDAIVEDTDAFASWRSATYVEDTRAWMIAGESSYKGAPLNTNSWGKVSGAARDKFLLARTAEGKNEFTLTLDMYKGDRFQIADVDVDSEYSWKAQRGYGYLDTDGVESYIKNAGNAFTDDLTKANIELLQNGSYTLTLTTEVDNPTLDVLKVTRNGDPEVDLVKEYAPSMAGSVTGGQAISDKANFGEFGLKKTAAGSGVYETTVSLNKGDFFSILLFENSWSDVLRTAAVDAEKSDACYDTADKGNITITESAKYKITLTFKDVADSTTGSIVLKKAGAFERTAGDNEVIFTDGETVTKAYVRKGARIPNPGDAAPQDGKLFIGWYSDLSGNVPVNFAGTISTESATLNCVPKFMSETDNDTRDVYISSDANQWGSNDPSYKMTRKSAHTYEFELTVEASIQFMFKFYEGEHYTGATANGSWVDYENSTNKASGTGNISIKTAGTYIVTMDTYSKKITVTEKA